METHAGYMGGLKREFCANCTLPYYATSSEEVLFHVSTRMPPKLEQKVRLSLYHLFTAVCRLQFVWCQVVDLQEEAQLGEEDHAIPDMGIVVGGTKLSGHSV